jgi:hypothetical protein
MRSLNTTFPLRKAGKHEKKENKDIPLRNPGTQEKNKSGLMRSFFTSKEGRNAGTNQRNISFSFPAFLPSLEVKSLSFFSPGFLI